MPANVPHSAPARRTGALGVIIAIVNMVFATAGLAWLVYALIKTGPEYVDLTNFEYSQWFLIFGLALIAIFFSGIIAFTGYGWGFVPAAWGYVLVLWLWQGMFARFSYCSYRIAIGVPPGRFSLRAGDVNLGLHSPALLQLQ